MDREPDDRRLDDGDGAGCNDNDGAGGNDGDGDDDGDRKPAAKEQGSKRLRH